MAGVSLTNQLYRKKYAAPAWIARTPEAPAVMDDRIQSAFTRAAEKHTPGKHALMPSGAGHDAQVITLGQIHSIE